MHSAIDYEKELKGLKAKIFLNHEISDYEIFLTSLMHQIRV